ncbi:hypothetical protein IW261DRAFT_1420311 [Armillaria novae-zelandiae]|uniref:Uncharacterized protein n=1 Tax=Armillaria novae-zelandiae TaxID=153914 RepID=A0AA39UE70_9AGAR|nr:hypothetical protein IW261DRAFT_1420311 [Armillaria novae-zelandiae]
METGWESLRVWLGLIDRRLLGVSRVVRVLIDLNKANLTADRGVVIKVLMTQHPDSPALELMAPHRNAEDLALIILQASSQQASTLRRKWTLRTVNKTFLVQFFSPLEVGHWDAEGQAQVVNGHAKYGCPDREMNE